MSELPKEWVVPRVPPNYANRSLVRGQFIAEKHRDKAAVLASWIASRKPRLTPPLTVRLTLCDSRATRMDHDNLGYRLKYVRDEVGRCLGVEDDRDGLYITWVYATQTRLPERFHTTHGLYGVWVQFERRDSV